MSAEIIPIGNLRRARKRVLHMGEMARIKLTDAQRYQYALARQRARTADEREMIAAIGPVDASPFGPGDAA